METRSAPFDVGSLGSEELTRLLNEVSSHVQRIRIEMVPCRGSHRSREEHPAAIIGLTAWSPTILFTDSMNTGERTEAIAHELVHLLLVYRFGLGVIGRRIPLQRTGQEVFSYFLSLNMRVPVGRVAIVARLVKNLVNVYAAPR